MTAAAPLVFADAYDMSRPGSPFSNGFEGETWMVAWCESCQHRSDCALLDVAYLGRTPSEWIELDPLSLRNRYFCKAWILDTDTCGQP